MHYKFTDRQEKELAMARIQALDALTSAAKTMEERLRGVRNHNISFDRDSKSENSSLQKWLSGYWVLPAVAGSQSEQWFYHTASGPLEFCISEEGIDYMVNTSANAYDFWTFTAKVAELYRGNIEHVVGSNDAARGWREYYKDSSREFGSPVKTLPLPPLPISLEHVARYLRTWDTFGDYTRAQFGVHFDSLTARTHLLSADLKKDLTAVQACFLAEQRVMITKAERVTGMPPQYHVTLHPLAKAILKLEATTGTEAAQGFTT